MALLERVRPHVIVSDLNLPGADGCDRQTRTRDLRPEDPGDCALGEQVDRRREARAGSRLDVHVAKPVSTEELVEAVLSASPQES